jgi:hypothetical protein
VKRHVYPPQRTVVVEDGTVRDLDGNTLGEVDEVTRGAWIYRTGASWRTEFHRTQKAAVFALVADPACPVGGSNLYDKGAAR